MFVLLWIVSYIGVISLCSLMPSAATVVGEYRRVTDDD